MPITFGALVQEDVMESGSDHSLQSINRALDILELLATERDGLGITTVAKRVGLSKSTAHRIAASLAGRGYVEQSGTAGTYRLGIKFIEVASYYINSLELQTEARPFLWELTSQLGLTTHLGILDGHEVIYVEKLDLFPGIRLYSQIGIRVPAYCSSLGKCLLSGLSSDELDAVMTHCAFERFTERTIKDLKELKKELRKVRAQGWAMDDEEHDTAYRCLGAPVFDYRGDIVAAISANGHKANLDDGRIPKVVEKIKATALQISRRLGYMP